MAAFCTIHGRRPRPPSPRAVSFAAAVPVHTWIVCPSPFEAWLKRLDALRMTGGERFNPVTGDFYAKQRRTCRRGADTEQLPEEFEVRPAVALVDAL